MIRLSCSCCCSLKLKPNDDVKYGVSILSFFSLGFLLTGPFFSKLPQLGLKVKVKVGYLL